MKKILFTLLVLPFISCTGPTNPNYEKNLAAAKKIFVLHGEENLEAQLALLSDDMTMNLFLIGGIKGLRTVYPNSMYTVY